MKKRIMATLIASIMCTTCFTGVSYAAEAKTDNKDAVEIVDIQSNMNQDIASDVMMDQLGISLMSGSGDAYESNNGPAVATTNRMYTTTYATIHEENDADWYQVAIGDISHPYSFILTDIPSGCDYDMYLVTYDDTNGLVMQYYDIKADNQSEAFYLNFAKTGIYYIVVQPKQGYSTTNYSDEQYKLYMGNYYKNGYYGYVNSGITARFGYVSDSNKTYKYSDIYSYDMTNNTSIPTGATVKEICLTDSGNGAHWLNFYKTISASSGSLNVTKLGTIDVMYSGDSNVPVKQVWKIQGKLTSSNSFVWQPLIQFSYQYPVTLQNERFW